MRGGLRDRSRRPASSSAEESALSVSALTRRIKSALEEGIGRVAVIGEIGSLTLARSGHIYLTIKDERATIDVVLWRSVASRLSCDLEEGEKVVVRGELSVYEPRGRYQLVASSLQLVGKGDLQQQFEEMVKKLRDEGLFLPEYKQPIPDSPQTVGVVTSATGAALRDIIKVLRKRMPWVEIVLSPCVVQGESASREICDALSKLERWGGCEVIIIGRGGGSLEDLWAFNDESVARAVFACEIPIVSAVGHEVDVSICDLVADVRAATPSEAAEMVVPDISEFVRRLDSLGRMLSQALFNRTQEARLRLSALLRSTVLRRPLDMIRQRQQIIDELSLDINHAALSGVNGGRARLGFAAARMEALNPLAVISRGYSVTTTYGGEVIKSVKRVKSGERIVSRISDGIVISNVVEIKENL